MGCAIYSSLSSKDKTHRSSIKSDLRALMGTRKSAYASSSTHHPFSNENTLLLQQIGMERAQINAIRISCATPKPSSANDPFNATFKGKEMHTAPP